MKIPVLTYHSVNVNGTEYHNNDHVAFEKDLELIRELGIQVISTDLLYQWMIGSLELNADKKYVVLTFDDGSRLDYQDWEHPEFGFIKSFYNSIKKYPSYHATSFVIASPEARKILEKTCLGGFPLWGDDWWQEVEDSEQISIENHSWDHLHPTLDKVAHSKNLKGDFAQVLTSEDANFQITKANQYIDSKLANKSTSFFAYPEGKFNEFLTDNYFPFQQNQIKAAFSCEANYISQNSNLWALPRFVCGNNWNSPKEFEHLLCHKLLSS